jgi:hypothetical protein
MWGGPENGGWRRVVGIHIHGIRDAGRVPEWSGHERADAEPEEEYPRMVVEAMEGADGMSRMEMTNPTAMHAPRRALRRDQQADEKNHEHRDDVSLHRTTSAGET